MHPCPCCGHKTLPRRASYELCPVCLWEDEGTEPWELSGPNGETLVEAQQRYEGRRLPRRLRPGRGRAPQRGEQRDASWRPLPVTEELLARVRRAHEDWEESMRDDLRGEDDLSTDGLHEYAAARRRLAEEAGGLSYEQVRSRLQELDARQGISRSRAHLELFSRLIKDERHYRGHPIRTAWWLLRHSRPRTLARRWREVRSGVVGLAG